MNNTSQNDNFQLFVNGVPWMVVYTCEAAMILTGNCVTVYIFWNIRKRLKRTSYLLINLAVADITVGIALILWLWSGITVMMGKDNSNIVIQTAIVIECLGVISSISSLALISLERMFAILWPFRHRMLNMWQYHVSAGVVWLIAFINATITVQFNVYTTNTNNPYRFVMAITIIILVVVITAAYFAILISTRRNRLASATVRSMEQNRKIAKTLFIVTILSIITCLPCGVGIAFTSYAPGKKNLFIAQIIIATQYANSFLNPVVYSFKMPEFQAAAKKLFRCPCHRKRSSFNYYSDASTSGVTLRSLKPVENN